MSNSTNPIKIQVTEEALPAQDTITLDILNEASKEKFSAVTPDLALRVATHEDFDIFTRAVLEYILDTPRTVEPRVGMLEFGMMAEMNPDTGKPGAFTPGLAAFAEGHPDQPQVHGPATMLGEMVMSLVELGKITPAEFVAVINEFPKRIENFASFYSDLSEDCDGDCENCTKHDTDEGQG
jgi:hypothetical protein